MKIKILRGHAKPQYSLLIPEDKEISDLDLDIQASIKNLGELNVVQSRELNEDFPSEKEAIERIKKQGAHLWKITVEFSEITGG